MPFYRIDYPGGQAICHMLIRGGAPAPCGSDLLPGDDPKFGPRCGRRSVALCDFPVDGKTCDVAMCEKHRMNVGKNVDHCPKHATQRPLFGGGS